ncbi:DUF4124 domain-containing protein [Vogesella oryzae]|uniref:DUF4124 domain-containing protein n=1 Tax=Vogesella oryzae TaxID=1735285 RepID=UPI0015842CBB|nr:DUF4124 domain-containing protein [Vogesella oryzae]
MPRYLTALLLATCCTTANADTIYKFVDKDGHVTFTNVPRVGANAIMVSPNGTTPSTSPRRKAALESQPPAAPGMPSIDAGTQRQRDVSRRRILETELANEHKALLIARGALLDAQQKNSSKPEQLLRLRDEVTDRERNIEALKRELGG